MCTVKSLGVWMFQSLRRTLCLAALVLTLFVALPTGSGEAQTPVPSTLVQAATPMLPYLDWLIDPSGTLTVTDMAAPAQQAAFRPLNLEKMPRETGTVWLRFTLAPRVLDARPNTYLLDMGEGVPGTPTLYIPKHNVLNDTTEWQDFTPSQRSIFLMPDAQTSPVTAYIKMSGLPGLWFAPMLRTPHNAATALERLMRPAVIVVLGVVMLLCLLRSLTERGEWRFWTSLYTGAALLHSVWGVPTLFQGHVPMNEIASVLAPGVALMLLPHVGRHLMHTRDTARIIDVQYILLSLPGAALALLPLVPGFSWTIRYLDLWPLGTLLLVPTTLGAWLMGLAGARRFLLGCLLPPLATAAGIMGIGTSVPAPLLATAPLWGVALSALLIAGTAAAREYGETDKPARAKSDSDFDPLHDPALRIVTPEELAQENAAPMPEPSLWEQNAPPRIPADSTALAWEEKLRGPLDSLLREGAALAECSLPPAARQYALTMQQNARAMSTLLSEPLDLEDGRAPEGDDLAEDPFFDLQQILRDAHDAVASNAENKNIALSWFMPPHLANRYVGDGRRLATCIRLLLESAVRATSRGGVQVAVRRVPESVDAGHLLFSVTDTGTGMPPHDRSSVALARAWELAAAHHGFLGVECGPHGASISFTVRLQVASPHALGEEGAQAIVASPRNVSGAAWGTDQAAASAISGATHVPDSLQPRFSTHPNSEANADGSAPRGSGGQGENAKHSATARQNGGLQGRTAAGDGVFVAAAQASAMPRLAIPRIIIVDDSLSNRQLLAFFLEGLAYQTQEARSPDEAVELYFASPAALIIFDGDMPEEDTLSAVGRIRAFEADHALPEALVLALTTDESRWDALHAGGFTHALVKPITRTGLRRTVQELLPAGTVSVPPLGEELLPPTDSAEAQSLLFPEYETAGILLPDASAATEIAIDSDDDEIIDTGEPLPDSAPTALNGSAAFSEPLSMSPETEAVEGAARAESGRMPLPDLDMPLLERASSNRPAEEKGEERRSQTLPIETESAASREVDDDSADVESVYPYPAHGSVSATAEAVKTLATPTEKSVQSDFAPAATPRAAVAAPSAAPTLPNNAAPAADDTRVEWVGEPMPMSKAAPQSVAAPADTAMPAATAAAPAIQVSGRILPPLKESSSGAPSALGHSSAAPSNAVEWVGEPMPMPKASPAPPVVQPVAQPVVPPVAPPFASTVTPTVASVGTSAVVTSAAYSASVTPPSSSAVTPAPTAPAAASAQITPAALQASDAWGAASSAETAVPHAVAHAPAQPTIPSPLPPIRDTRAAADAPSRVSDLLTPYTRASFADEAALAAAKADAVQESVKQAPPSSAFIPLSFESPKKTVKTSDLTFTPPSGGQGASASSLQEIPRSERLSLIPEESPLLDFIIAPAQNGASVKAAAVVSAPAASGSVVSGLAASGLAASGTAVSDPTVSVAAVSELVSPNPAPSNVTSSDSVSVQPVQASLVPSVPPASASATQMAPASGASQMPAALQRPVAAAAPSVARPNPTAVNSLGASSAAPSAPAAAPAAAQGAKPSLSSSPDSPIPTMLEEFDEAMRYARGGFVRKNIQAVHEAAVYIANRSDTCGLRVLARMARCVGEAAKAEDMDALNNLLPELETAVERNKIALLKK